MEKGDLSFLLQLIKSLEEYTKKLKTAYEKKDAEDFNKIKVEIVNLYTKMEEILNGK